MEFNSLLEKIQSLPRKDLEAIAQGAAVPLGTLIKIWNGQTPNPRIRTVESLHRHMGRRK